MAKLSGGRLAAALAFKAARGRKGISQRALAEGTGVLREVINRFETGKTWPDATTQAKLEPAVGLPSGALEEIAARYEIEPDLVDREIRLTEELTQVRRGRASPSGTAERIRRLEEDLARNDQIRERIVAELEELRATTRD